MVSLEASKASVVRRRRDSFNHLFLRNNCANQSQFHMELLWDGETKVCSNGSEPITNMAAMPIYGKNRKNIFSGTKRAMTWKRCRIGCSSSTKLVQIMTLV